jgi:hypothetical protein
MARPSKKDIKAAIDKLKDDAPRTSTDGPDYSGPALSPKKPNKNRIRKQGV